MDAEKPIRVVALIYPLERHVGHWACSSRSIDLHRVVMDGRDMFGQVAEAVRLHQPHAIAVIGKKPEEYLGILDNVGKVLPDSLRIPRIYRCQNTVLAHRFEGMANVTKSQLAQASDWFRRACDTRFSLILVQTVDDVPLISRALKPAHVVSCPYGYDRSLFDPDYPERHRPVDVGCYFNLKDDCRRSRLVEHAQAICRRRGWRFCFTEGVYGHEYAAQIRATKVCLHSSIDQEIPYRLYETTALGALFVTDPLRYHIDSFYERGREYLTYTPDLSDLEVILDGVLSTPALWESIRLAGKSRARNYSWEHIAEDYVAPAMRSLLQTAS